MNHILSFTHVYLLHYISMAVEGDLRHYEESSEARHHFFITFCFTFTLFSADEANECLFLTYLFTYLLIFVFILIPSRLDKCMSFLDLFIYLRTCLPIRTIPSRLGTCTRLYFLILTFILFSAFYVRV